MEETVYLSLCGELLEPYCLPWVENAFADGSFCDLAYGEILDAYGRICARLHGQEEDPDLEIIMDSFLRIQQHLCLEMFRYGVMVGKGKK